MDEIDWVIAMLFICHFAIGFILGYLKSEYDRKSE